MKTIYKKSINLLIGSLIVYPVVWAGAILQNPICNNFIIFFNFYVCLVLISYLFAFEKIEETLKVETIPNEYLSFIFWIIPICMLIAGGFIISGLLWFFTWAVCHSKIKEFLQKNDKQNNNT